MKGKSPAFFILAFSAVLAGFIIVSWFKGVGFKLFLAIASTSGEQSGALAESIRSFSQDQPGHTPFSRRH